MGISQEEREAINELVYMIGKHFHIEDDEIGEEAIEHLLEEYDRLSKPQKGGGGQDAAEESEVFCIRLRFEGHGDPDNLVFMDLNKLEPQRPEIVKQFRQADYAVTLGQDIDDSITEEDEWVEYLFYQSGAEVKAPCKIEKVVTFIVPYEYV